jgi:hypothetical protein
MSVRASLEADTVASAGFNRKRAPSDSSQEIGSSKFHQSFEALLACAGTEAGHPGPDGQDTALSSLSSQSTAQIPMDGANRHQAIASKAADHARPGGVSSNNLVTSSHAKLLTPATVPEQVSCTSGFRASQAIGSISPVNRNAANRNANDIDAASNTLAPLISIGLISAPIENGPIGTAMIASSFPIENRTTASISSTTELSASTSSIPSGTSRTQTASCRIPFAANQPNNRTGGKNGSNPSFPELGTDQALPVQVGAPKSLEVNARTNLQMDAPALQNYASDDVMSASNGSPQSGFDRAPISNNSTAAGSQPSPGRAKSRAQSATAYEDANDGSMQMRADDAGLESVRDSNRSTNGSHPAVGSSDVVKSISVSKLTSPRSESNDSRLQNTKRALQNAPDAFTPHSLDVARITEVTNAESATQKTVDVKSSGIRLQDTFAALEPGTGYDTGTLHWNRAGHVQAEAGYQDPELGWIGVRVETSGGVVHATLSPQSSDAAQTLSGHIAGLHTHLSDNHTPVDTLTLAPFWGNAHQFAGQESGQGGGQGTRQNNDQNSAPEPELQVHSNALQTHGAQREMPSAEELLARSNTGISSRGGHISVLA